MAISITYGQMQHQIADELGDRQDLLAPLSDSSLNNSPIQLAIQTAIAKWERVPFYFTETFDASFFTMTAGTGLYDTSTVSRIATSSNLFAVHLVSVDGNTRYPLIRATWKQIDDLSTSATAKSRPTHWGYFAQTLRFYPLPDAAYTVSAAYTKRQPTLVNSADTGLWTQDGADLIRAEAKLQLALEVIHDPQVAQEMRLAIYGDPNDPRTVGYLQVLLDETERRDRYDSLRLDDDPAGKRLKR